MEGQSERIYEQYVANGLEDKLKKVIARILITFRFFQCFCVFAFKISIWMVL